MSQLIYNKTIQANYKTVLLLIIIYSIGFQQFPVIRVGGSYKIYEIVATFLLCLYISKPNIIKFANKESLVLFLFLVMSPIASYFIFLTNLDNINLYYKEFSDAIGFRYDYQIGPVIMLIYFMFAWVAVNEIIRSRYITLHLEKILRVTVYIGTFIAIYSLYSAIFVGLFHFVDLIKLLPDLIQNKTNNTGYGLRSGGFSQEPSFYILYQGWIVLILWNIRHTFTKIKKNILIFINFTSLILTLSSGLVAFFILGIAYLLINLNSFKRVISGVLFFIIVFVIVYAVLDYFELISMVEYILFNKIDNFFSVPEHTRDSGSFRAYTSLLGIEIFKDYPLFGVGPGCSNFFMHLYEKNFYITLWGEELTGGSFPQSSFSKVLAEQGLFGFTSMLLFFLMAIHKFYKNINNKYISIFFYGTIMTFILLTSIGPIYSLFIWVFIALGLNALKLQKIKGLN